MELINIPGDPAYDWATSRLLGDGISHVAEAVKDLAGSVTSAVGDGISFMINRPEEEGFDPEYQLQSDGSLKARNIPEYKGGWNVFVDALLGKGLSVRRQLATEISELARDAAALCQYAYALNPNSGNKTSFHTSKGNWYVFSTNSDSSLGSFSFEPDSGNSGLIRMGTKYARKLLGKDARITLAKLDKYRFGGLGSELFYQTDADGTLLRVAYVTEGTSGSVAEKKGWWRNPMAFLDIVDDIILTDILQALTGISAQYTVSIQNAKAINTALCNEVPLFFFGHSLGGGLAAANAKATNRAAITFNAAGLNHIRKFLSAFGKGGFINAYMGKNEVEVTGIKNDGSSCICPQITSYYTYSDFLSSDRSRALVKLLKIMFSTPDGERKYIGGGGHSLADICKKFGLKEFNLEDTTKIKQI